MFTFGAEVHAFHIERAIPQGYFLQYDAKTVHITLLCPLRRMAVVYEQLRSRPKLLWETKHSQKHSENVGNTAGAAVFVNEQFSDRVNELDLLA